MPKILQKNLGEFKETSFFHRTQTSHHHPYLTYIAIILDFISVRRRKPNDSCSTFLRIIARLATRGLRITDNFLWPIITYQSATVGDREFCQQPIVHFAGLPKPFVVDLYKEGCTLASFRSTPMPNGSGLSPMIAVVKSKVPKNNNSIERVRKNLYHV